MTKKQPSDRRNDSTADSTDCEMSSSKAVGTRSKDEAHQTNDPICPIYLEERSDRHWQELLADTVHREPRCGHAIHYLKTETKAKIRRNTAQRYASSLCLFVEFLHSKGFCVCDAELKDIHEYFRMRARTGRRERTIAGDRTAIVNLYKYTDLYRVAKPNVRWAMIREEIKPSSYQTKNPIEREPLTKKEVVKLYDNMLCLRDKLMVQVGVELGPRNTDLRTIRIRDIELAKKKINLKNTKTRGRYDLPITDELALLLRRWIDVERKAVASANSEDYLFPSRRGGALSSPSLNDIIKASAERAGIQEIIGEVPVTDSQKIGFDIDVDTRKYHKVTVHALRHTFNYLLEKAGLSREARSGALDHSSTQVTKEFYDYEETDYYQLMNRLFKGASRNQRPDDD